MEIILIAILLCVIVGIAYFYAEAKTLKGILADAKEREQSLKGELREWQSKWLVKTGATPLNYVPPDRKKDSVEITPRVVHRGQLEARLAERDESGATPINIHADKVVIPKEEVIQKAAEIINVPR